MWGIWQRQNRIFCIFKTTEQRYFQFMGTITVINAIWRRSALSKLGKISYGMRVSFICFVQNSRKKNIGI